jgi:hypothetical protein
MPVRRFISVPTSVERNPEALGAGIARLERDQLLASKHRCDLESRIAQRARNRAHHLHAGDHVVSFRRQRLAQTQDVAALIHERWLRELEVDLAHIRVEDDEAPQTHRRGLRHSQKLRHVADHVVVDAGLAR